VKSAGRNPTILSMPAPKEGAVKLLGVERDEGVAGCGVVLIGACVSQSYEGRLRRSRRRKGRSFLGGGHRR
jgi:hypothetical protein